jgi:hypothetical protein
MNEQNQNASLHRKSEVKAARRVEPTFGWCTLNLSVEKDCLDVNRSTENPDFADVRIRVPAIDPERIKPIEVAMIDLGIPDTSRRNILDLISDELMIECLREMIKK